MSSVDTTPPVVDTTPPVVVQRFLGASTTIGRIVWIEDSLSNPLAILKHEGGRRMMSVALLQHLGVAITACTERVAVKREIFKRLRDELLDALKGASAADSILSGYAITTEEDAAFWLEPQDSEGGLKAEEYKEEGAPFRRGKV